jgi:hypothetical protein
MHSEVMKIKDMVHEVRAMHSEVLNQVRRGESLLQSHIEEIADSYQSIYSDLRKGKFPDPSRLEHLATIAPTVARLYREWETEVGGASMYTIIEQLEKLEL